MRVLTVRQPWAWAIIHGGKDVENRLRNIAGDYRGPVAIHAGLTYDFQANQRVRNLVDSRTGRLLFGSSWRRSDWSLGSIVGVANLWAVHRDADGGNCCPRTPWADRGVWHLCLDAPQPLREPLPYRGALGLRSLPAEVVEQIGAQL